MFSREPFFLAIDSVQGDSLSLRECEVFRAKLFLIYKITQASSYLRRQLPFF